MKLPPPRSFDNPSAKLTEDLGRPRTKHPTPTVLHSTQAAAALSTALSARGRPPPPGTKAPSAHPCPLPKTPPASGPGNSGSRSCMVRNMVLTMALRMKLRGRGDVEWGEGGGSLFYR